MAVVMVYKADYPLPRDDPLPGAIWLLLWFIRVIIPYLGMTLYLGQYGCCYGL